MFPIVRIVVIAPTWLGDSVMSLPLLGFLTAARDVRVTVVTPADTGRVFWGVEGISDLVVLAKSGRMGRIGAHRVLVKSIDADGAVILPPSFSSAFGTFLAGVRVRVGVASDARRLLLTAAMTPRGLREEHLSENYLRLGRLLFEKLSLPCEHRFAVPRVKTFESERRAVTKELEKAGAAAGDYVVVVPGATYGPTKSWPKEKYRELVRALSKDFPVVLGGSAGERGLCSSVGGGVEGVVNLAGRTTLGEFMALLAGGRAVVANDSGAPHLAASLGVPAVVIFGSTSPRWTVPLGEKVHAIREPVRCSPCFRRECPTDLECYQGISVEKVLDITRLVVKKSVEKKGSS
jgi:heptosyltransferase-2